MRSRNGSDRGETSHLQEGEHGHVGLAGASGGAHQEVLGGLERGLVHLRAAPAIDLVSCYTIITVSLAIRRRAGPRDNFPGNVQYSSAHVLYTMFEEAEKAIRAPSCFIRWGGRDLTSGQDHRHANG